MTDATVPDDAAAFMNTLRKCWCLDKYRLPFMTNDEWIRFRDNPPGYMIRCGDKHLIGIWAALHEDDL